RQVLAIQQIEEVDVRPHFRVLTEAEGLLSAQVNFEEPSTAFFNLSVLDHKPSPLTIHRGLRAARRRRRGRQWLTSQLRLQQTQRINARTNPIDADSPIAVYIDAGKRGIGPCSRKLDDWRKLESVSKIENPARDYPMALVDSCWSKLFRFELILRCDGNAIPAVRGRRLSAPGLRFR